MLCQWLIYDKVSSGCIVVFMEILFLLLKIVESKYLINDEEYFDFVENQRPVDTTYRQLTVLMFYQIVMVICNLTSNGVLIKFPHKHFPHWNVSTHILKCMKRLNKIYFSKLIPLFFSSWEIKDIHLNVDFVSGKIIWPSSIRFQKKTVYVALTKTWLGRKWQRDCESPLPYMNDFG